MAAAPVRGLPTQLSHVAIRVRDLDRAVDFYTHVVGLKLRGRRKGAAFLGIREDASHELALFALPPEAPGPNPEGVGMYHMAWEVPSFEDLEQFHRRLVESGARITGYSDRQCNVMFLDPDGNELEVFWELPRDLAELAEGPGGVALPRLAH
ncbi:MAG TPA: VOC family protein [Chloroflexota bacterium]|nr:VOC family protein [Chloroflexota bacterium]